MQFLKNLADAMDRNIVREREFKRDEYAAENKKLHDHLLKVLQAAEPHWTKHAAELNWDYEPSGYQGINNGEIGS